MDQGIFNKRCKFRPGDLVILKDLKDYKDQGVPLGENPAAEVIDYKGSPAKYLIKWVDHPDACHMWVETSGLVFLYPQNGIGRAAGILRRRKRGW